MNETYMNKGINRNKQENLFAMMTLSGACIALCAVLILSFTAIRSLSADYQQLIKADLSSDFTKSISYDDRLYAAVGKGIVMDDTTTIADRPGHLYPVYCGNVS